VDPSVGQDPGPSNDYLGGAYTDANGRYVIVYRGGHWDPAPHNITIWRPDSFINVLVNIGTDWVRVASTRDNIKDDWPLKNDLTLNVKLTERNQWISIATKFDPAIHGWSFANDRFRICAAPTCKDEHWAGHFLRKVLTFRWALCGGMSLTSLRRFRNNQVVEPFSPTVKAELSKAQLETVTPTTWAKFIQWQAKPTLPHPPLGPHTIGEGTKGEWGPLHKSIDRGVPMVLGLIRVQSTNPQRRRITIKCSRSGTGTTNFRGWKSVSTIRIIRT